MVSVVSYLRKDSTLLTLSGGLVEVNSGYLSEADRMTTDRQSSSFTDLWSNGNLSGVHGLS